MRRKLKARLKRRNCAKCHKLMDDPICPKCDCRTFPNSYIKRFPRLDPDVERAMRAAKPRNEDLWMRVRPWQGGLPQ